MYLVAVNVTSAVSKPFQWDWPDLYIHFEQQMLEDLCRRVCDLVWLEVLNCLSFTGNCAKFLKCCDCLFGTFAWFPNPPTYAVEAKGGSARTIGCNSFRSKDIGLVSCKLALQGGQKYVAPAYCECTNGFDR